MLSAHHVLWSHMEADRAFSRAARSRRRASVTARLLRRCLECARLVVLNERALARSNARATGVRAIPIEAIIATVEPGRAREFDSEFRPVPRMRSRWTRVWVAEHTGPGLPPISVVQVGDGYAIRDGHHRVSVARARGAVTIDAIVA
jgi:hypothetical protein